jgi:hypothetical protein
MSYVTIWEIGSESKPVTKDDLDRFKNYITTHDDISVEDLVDELLIDVKIQGICRSETKLPQHMIVVVEETGVQFDKVSCHGKDR